MTTRSAVLARAEHALRVRLWWGTGVLLAITVTIGITSIVNDWPPIPFNLGLALAMLVGIPAANDTMRARRIRHDNAVLDALEGELEDQFHGI